MSLPRCRRLGDNTGVRLLLALLLLVPSLAAQITLGGESKEKKESPVDPLGRSSPRGTLYGFLRAAQEGRYRLAAQYLDVPEIRRDTLGVSLARDLRFLFDTSFHYPLSLVSDRPEGTIEENLAPLQERAGEFVVGDQSVDLILVRKTDQNLPVWLIAAPTLDQVPALQDRVTGSSLVSRLPESLSQRFLGLMWWQWAGALILFALCLLAGFLLSRVTRWITRRRFATADISKILPWTLAVLLHVNLIGMLAIPLLYRTYYRRAVNLFLLFGLGWILFTVISQLSARAQDRALAAGRLATNSWLILLRRILKVTVAGILMLIGFASLGFDMSTALAGVGIGGIAIAFAAQKTLENLFGGVSMASDQVIRIGDTCSFNGRVGTVTDIGLRSTRVRTLDRVELSIPNGILAGMSVENLSLRDKFLFNPILGVRYDTTQPQLRQILTGIRELFAADPRVEPGGRVRLLSFADSAIQIEIFVYLLATEFNIMAEIREDLLLKIQGIIEAAGSGFAFPSRTVYLEYGEGSGPRPPLPTETDAPEPGRG